MKRFAIMALTVGLTVPAFASTHKFDYTMPCSALWPAVKDTLRNSGKYGIIGIDNTEMTASYMIGGNLTGKRINSLVLNTIPTGCELQVQTAFSGIFNDDINALKTRVDESLAKLQPAKPETPTPPITPAAPATPTTPTTPATPATPKQ
jgi:hypothetical protein